MTFMINQTFTIFMDIFCIKLNKDDEALGFFRRLWIWKEQGNISSVMNFIWAMLKF